MDRISELHDLKHEICLLKNQMQAIGSLAASAAKLAATFSAIGAVFTQRDAGENEKSSWMSKLLNGARTGASIWSALRTHLK